MFIVLSKTPKEVTLGKFYGVNENFNGIGVVLDTKRNLIIGVDNTSGKVLDPDTIPMDHYCGANFINSQFYVQLESNSKEIIVSYKKVGTEFTPCFTIPKSLADAHFLVAGNTSPTDTQTYDLYNIYTEISDDMMGPMMEMIAEVQEGMKEEVADLMGEVGEITGALSELPTKEKLKELTDTIIKTRE